MVIERYVFKNGARIGSDVIARANGEFVKLDDYDKVLNNKNSEIAELKNKLEEMSEYIEKIKNQMTSDKYSSSPISIVEKLVDSNTVDELEQIGQHISVYCQHNKR